MRGRLLLLLGLLLGPMLLPTVGAQPSSTQVLLSLDRWPMPAETEQGLRGLGASVEERFAFARTVLVEAPAGSQAALEQLPGVVEVTPDAKLTWTLASSKRAVGWTPELRAAGLNGSGVNIALVDSGIDAEHPGLAPQVVSEMTVTSKGTSQGSHGESKHGTHVAGVLVGTGAGAAPERGDVSGMAPAAGLISLDISKEFTTSNALRAFEWIYEHNEERDIEVVANSWGRMRDPARYEADDPIIRASDALVADGVTVVFSAGNGGPEPSKMTLEATNPNVITVGAATDEGEVEPYSSRGPVYVDGQEANWTKPDLVAPGSHIVSARAGGQGPGSNYAMMNGTSMAAPHVAGAAAALLGLRPNLTPGQIKGLLTESARDVAAPGVDDASGAGMLDLGAAVAVLQQTGGELEKRSETMRKQGQLTGPQKAGPALQTASVDHEDRIHLRVPENATELAGTVRWDGGSGLEVRVLDPQGREVEQVVVQEAKRIRVADPAEGRWTIELSPQDVSRGRYQAELTVTWTTYREGVQIPVAAHRSSSGSFPSTGGGPLDPFASTWLPGVPNVVPMVAGGLLTAVMVVGKLTNRGSSEREPPPETTTFEPVGGPREAGGA